MINKPSEKEEEYFVQQELMRLKKLRDAAALETASEEREEAKKRHYMRCPKCGGHLEAIHYRDVEVDSCLSCSGMYLDAGEIEKILAFKEAGAFNKFAAMLLGKES
ncbi:MAG: hypothetical protein GY906_19160 [bacterium]|nr:hypothetical protein [bacterium]